MTSDTLSLREARRLYHRRQYARIIHAMERKVFEYYDDLEFFHLLGACYFRTGDMNGAHAFLTRVLKIDPKHVDANVLLGAIAALRGDLSKAVTHCLTALDQRPDEPRARLLLDQLRRRQSRDDLIAWVRGPQFRRIQPLIPGKPLPLGWIFGVSLGISALIGLAVVLPRALERWFGPLSPERVRPGIAERGIEGFRELLRFNGAFEEVLTAAEIERLYAEAQRLMFAYRDNEARVLLNRILRSNASDQVRDQALSLIQLQSRPDFTTEFHSFRPDEIRQRPTLYEGVYVRWKGSVANMSVAETEIRFDFLVGYHEGRVLEAVVPAVIRFAVRMDNGDPIDVLGQVVVADSTWFLDVVGVHVMGVRRTP